jgi:hypothetical protein
MRKLCGRNIIIGALLVGSALPLTAATIFDNSSNDLRTRFNPGTFEVGDQIVFAGTDRSVTNFSFEFYGQATSPVSFAGNVQVKVAFYQNDGAAFNGYASPNTKIWESAWFTLLGPTPRNTLVFTAGSDFPAQGLVVPNEMTWSVQFRNLGSGDVAGVDLYSPPTVGQSYSDYWQNDGSGWQLMTNSVVSRMDFGARFQATAVVPEPTALTLSIFGGFGLLLMSRWVRRNR